MKNDNQHIEDLIFLDALLERQLNRLDLGCDKLPENILEWKNFLKRINQTYVDNAQDRYLLERSLTLVSQEMADLNEKIENAQRIAHLGYWTCDMTSGKTTWSKEIYNMLGFDTTMSSPSYSECMENYVHPNDVVELEKTIQQSLTSGEDYEVEIRLLNIKTKLYKWYFVKGHPHPKVNPNDPVSLLSGIVMDITKRKESELEINELNQKLILSARRAGMAEMAISVLHNIGNVLNSVNVSSAMLVENLNKLRINNLESAALMIKENQDNLVYFFNNDEKGKLIPQYIIALVAELKKEYLLITQEIKNIMMNTEHMKEIIKKQSQVSMISRDIYEKFNLKDLLNDAIQLSLGSQYQIDTRINMKDENIELLNDKHKLLQVIINLIRNAADSLKDAKNNKGQIEITTCSINNNLIQILISDNGVGITNENLSKVFNFGFTTKEKGHGFGLHNSALIAKELGGSLTVQSDGANRGATFIFEFPVSLKEVGHE